MAPRFWIKRAPIFDVMIMIVFLKSTVLPSASVRIPSSKTCNRMLKMSGCAFSISSNNKTEYGERFTRSVNCPPSSWPTYPGGEPISFETECFSISSDMSKRIIERWLPNKNSARHRATSVLPTPVGPRKRNEPTGRCGFFKPARERRIARAKAEIAGRCEITRLCNSFSMRRSFFDSPSLSETIGMPVQRAMTSSMSLRLTSPITIWSSSSVIGACARP